MILREVGESRGKPGRNGVVNDIGSPERTSEIRTEKSY